MADELENLSFEKALEKLQNTVQELESGQLSLETSLKRFEEGVKLTRHCQNYLEKAEQKVQVLSQPEEAQKNESTPPETQDFKA